MDGSSAPAIRLRGFTKRYGDFQAVRGIDLEVRTGEVFGFVGPNGAGKSTTIRCLLDLLRPTAGQIEVLGRDPRRDGVAIRRRIGYVPGELRLPDRMTGAELLAATARLRDIDADLATSLAERLNLDLARHMRDLSTGNRRKVALLLAFAARPELLILDEPTNGLDPLMQHVFQGLLAEVRAAGTTVFLSSHVLSEVQRTVDRLAVIKAGRIIAQGTLADLRPQVRQRLDAWFRDPVRPADVAAIPGLETPVIQGRHLVADLSGPVDPVLAFLASHAVSQVSIQEPDLEEAFLELYGEAA